MYVLFMKERLTFCKDNAYFTIIIFAKMAEGLNVFIKNHDKVQIINFNAYFDIFENNNFDTITIELCKFGSVKFKTNHHF